MTYWATLWYAGSVVLTLGYEGQTENECDFLGQQIMYDIAVSYTDPETVKEIEHLFPTDEFSFTCETEMLEIDPTFSEG